MNRDALLLYLRDLRDLEVAKYQITKTINQNTAKTNTMTQNLQREINQAQQPNYYSRPVLPNGFVSVFSVGGTLAVLSFLVYYRSFGLYFLLSFGLLISLAVLFITGREHERLTSSALVVVSMLPIVLLCALVEFYGIFSFVGKIGLIILLIALLKYLPSYVKECKKIEEYNRQEQERLTKAPAIVQQKSAHKQEIINSWKKKDAILKNDLQKANALLQKAYGHNLLASTYRNLASIYYIYDYMSTSTATLEETLIHEHMENGIQRILSKLDVIIGKQEEQILSARRIECNTKTIIDQNTHMLDTLQQTLASQLRTEQNTLETAQYARIATTYAQTTAFFSSATYFQNGGSLLIR